MKSFAKLQKILNRGSTLEELCLLQLKVALGPRVHPPMTTMTNFSYKCYVIALEECFQTIYNLYSIALGKQMCHWSLWLAKYFNMLFWSFKQAKHHQILYCEQQWCALSVGQVASNVIHLHSIDFIQ